MTRPLSDLIIEFVAGLRAAGVRISVAESLDAMRAIGVACLALPRMREALRAALIKDEADSPIFDTLFASYFRGPPHDSDPNPKSRGMRAGVIGGQGGSSAAAPERPASKSAAEKGVQTDPTEQDEPEERSTAPGRASDSGDPGDSSENPVEAGSPEGATAVAGRGFSPEHHDDRDHHGPDAALANLRRIESVPFASYSPLEYDLARDALAILRRRWQ